MTELNQQVQEYISNGLTKKAITVLLNSVGDEDSKQQILIISARYENIHRKINTGIATPEEIRIEENQINQALLAIAQQLKVEDVKNSPLSNIVSEPEYSGFSFYKIAFFFGIVMSVLILGITLWKENPSPDQRDTFKTLLALAVACVGIGIPGVIKLDFSPVQKMALSAGGALTLFCIVFFTNPAAREDTFSLTVNVIGTKGLHDKPLKGKGHIELFDEYAHPPSEINSNGEAIINGIAPKFKTTPIRLNIVKETDIVYEAIQPDSQYIVGNQKTINFIVKIVGLAKATGIIRDSENQPLLGVKVSLSKGISAMTDDEGRFIIDIPLEFQKRELSLTASKENYVVLDFKMYPETDNEPKLQMKKRRK